MSAKLSEEKLKKQHLLTNALKEQTNNTYKFLLITLLRSQIPKESGFFYFKAESGFLHA